MRLLARVHAPGWSVVKGFAVYELASGDWVAHKRWWNAQSLHPTLAAGKLQNASLWVDFTPFPEGHTSLFLVVSALLRAQIAALSRAKHSCSQCALTTRSCFSAGES